jgi:NADH-quinone oxidoreductase subunit D
MIVDSVSTVGYIHRAFEKLAEHRPYNQITPITDRLNYCSSPINNMGWHMTVEKLIGAKIPKTCTVYACHYYGIISYC